MSYNYRADSVYARPSVPSGYKIETAPDGSEFLKDDVGTCASWEMDGTVDGYYRIEKFTADNLTHVERHMEALKAFLNRRTDD